MSPATDEIRLTGLIAPSFYALHWELRDERFREFLLAGGRGSTKSTFASVEIAIGLLEDPDAHAIVYRKVGETLRDTVFNQMLWSLDRLGLTPHIRVRTSPHEITFRQTGQRILFKGADDPNKSKGLKLARGYYKYLWFEELPEFSGMEDIQTIRRSVVRGTMKRAITLYSYNPPKSANSWVNMESLIAQPGRRVHQSDYRSVPEDWLGPDFLADAETLRVTNERAWRHVYLGEITGTGGQVFDNVVVREITPDERGLFDRFLNGGDFGFAQDPDAVLRMHYDRRSRTLYLLEEIYGLKMNVDVLSKKVRTMIGSEYVTYENADPRMINELQRRNIHVLPAKKGPGSVEHGMRWLQELGGIIIDPVRCPNAAREFTGYEYKQDRFGNFLSEYPDKDNHTIDAARYGCESEMHGKMGFASTMPAGRGIDRIYAR